MTTVRFATSGNTPLKIAAFAAILTLAIAPAVLHAQAKFVGVEDCAECHESEKSGDQVGVWKQTSHAEAYKTLATPRADSIATSKGIATPAAGAAECLQCHTIPSEDRSVLELGVQCEACHGAGSAYQRQSVMKDKEASIAAGLTAFPDQAAVEAKCRSCHNEKSPTFKEFIFEERWAKIKHPRPKE